MTVGADSTAKNDGSLWYICRVAVQDGGKTSLGKKIILIPGMIAQVDIVNGERTVMDYLLEPVSTVADEAFREISFFEVIGPTKGATLRLFYKI